MGFFTEHCPNCGKNVARNAEYCNACGCPTATSWATCPRCQASVGGESRFCWKCGTEQDAEARRALYGDRWHRSATDFAVRVEISVPEKVLRHGIQVDEGTLALLFQDGKYKGALGPGYHGLDNFFQRLLGMDKGKSAHAILLDTEAAEIDFMVENARASNNVPLDVRVRLLFKLTDAKLFADRFLQTASSFSTIDLANTFAAEVQAAMQEKLRNYTVDDLMTEARTREVIEGDMLTLLNPVLASHGLEVTGIRLADFGGQAMEYIREKLGEIGRLDRELELNRKLRDAVRTEKVDAFRDEEQLKDYYGQVAHEFGFNSVDREQEMQRFVQSASHRTQLEGLRQDYENRRAEILNRLDEQVLRHQDEIVEVRHQVEVDKVKFEENVRQTRVRFAMGQEQQSAQARTDLDVAKQGIEALKLVKDAKLKARADEETLAIKFEAERLKLRGDASMQGLLATLTGEQADRVLKLAELEMRKGMSAEQALALVAEKSPEIAPSVAEALKVRYAQGAKNEKKETG